MLRLLASLIIASVGLQLVAAQSDVSCLPFYDWSFNSQKKSPCEVASSLIAVCDNGSFPVPALPDMSHYIGPTIQAASPCQCNTVAYSLMSACGACQGRTYLSWSVWSANCPMVYTSAYPEPIPAGVAVPGWAYLDVKTNDNFDPINAKLNANVTESSAVPSPTPTPTSSTKVTAKVSSVPSTSASTPSSISSPSAVPSDSADSTSSASSQEAHANTVGGAIVGCLAGASLLVGLLFWYIRRRNRAKRNGAILASPRDTENPTLPAEGGPYMQQASTMP